MPIDPQAQALRRRAGELRRLAVRLDAVALGEVLAWAGPDTWRSPAADECRAMLSRDRQRIAQAADELRDRAWRLDRQAEALEVAEALQVVR